LRNVFFYAHNIEIWTSSSSTSRAHADQLETKSMPRFAEYRTHVLELIRATSRPDVPSADEQDVAAALHGR
jgi:hypothetical protein